MRLILYLGKGGVGKTTLAAATAARAAQLGKRTLVVSTDLAHSLADALDRPLTAEPMQIASSLWAQEINVLDEMRSQWGRVQNYITTVLKKQGINEVAAEEMALIPGMDEIVALLNIYRQARDSNYDVVVIDAAPTGETVRLLSMPETFLWYVNQANGWKGLALNAAKPLLKTFLPGVNVLDSLAKLNDQVAALRKVLTNPDISSYRLVVNPEKMVIKEALRAETYLALYDYPIDGVVCNRVLPPPPAGGYQDALLRDMATQQRRYYEQIHSTFAPLPVWDAPYRSQEVLGAEALAALGAEIWGNTDPTQVFFRGSPQELIKRGESYLLRLPLPHVELSKVVMTKKGDELIVEVGNFKRDIALPAVLVPMEATVARMTEGALEVTFTAPAASARA
ncbi:MAG TPA: ArsA family ATPase [Ktedonobacterales bacterium]|nr:ArsA family ATPase [Ktedonobacterales bacterium]